jgi:transmembrane sensor
VTELKLPRPVGCLFEPREPEERILRVWRGVVSRRAQEVSDSRHRTLLMAASAVGVLAVVLVLFVGRGRVPGVTASVAELTTLESVTTPREVDLEDGASVRLETGTRLDVLERLPSAVSLALRRGRARFDIRAGGAFKWRIDCGAVTVEVVGTRFVLERDDRQVRVEVERGRVLVRGEGVMDRVQAVDAGGHMVVSSEPRGPGWASVPWHSLPLVDAGGASEPIPNAQASSSNAVGEWQNAARDRDWNRAWDALGETGIARITQGSDDVAELLTLADVARLSGHPRDAVAPLERIVTAYAGDSRAALAAFMLGRVWLDSLGNPARAIAPLERALSLGLPAGLEEDAEARLVEAYARAGNPQQARALAEEYRAHFPGGWRISDVDRWSPRE